MASDRLVGVEFLSGARKTFWGQTAVFGGQTVNALNATELHDFKRPQWQS